jgi:GT2 family glycosyltransferase
MVALIPVLGVPVLNRGDLAERMLDSVDVETGETLVILNGDPDDTRAMLRGRHVTYIDPGFNLGVAASWNFVIRARPAAPWWFIVNADIEFGLGDLERLVEAMQDPAPRLACLYEFGAFAINQAALDGVGWFDENFHPIYFEDNDYRRRCQLAGVPVLNLISRTRHDNSSTIASGYARHNERTFPRNGDYYVNKWGGPPGRETVTAPQTPVLDRRRLVDNAWT